MNQLREENNFLKWGKTCVTGFIHQPKTLIINSRIELEEVINQQYLQKQIFKQLGTLVLTV